MDNNDLILKIAALEDRIRRLESIETSNVVFLNQVARVLSDGTVRTFPYNLTLQVTGVAGLPSAIRGVFYNLYIQSSGTAVKAIVENPSYPYGANNYIGPTAGQQFSVPGYVSLNNAGQLYLSYVSGTSINLIIDVWAYVPGKTP